MENDTVRKHTATQPGYINNGTSAYTCEECWIEVRFIHLSRHDAWHRRLKGGLTDAEW